MDQTFAPISSFSLSENELVVNLTSIQANLES